MKARSLIVRALLLTLLLSPLGLRAFGSSISVHSCRVPSHRPKQHQPVKQAGGSSHQALLAAFGHRQQSQRIHRLRGKRINIDSGFVPASDTVIVAAVSSSASRPLIQEIAGPNPPRGPPSLI